MRVPHLLPLLLATLLALAPAAARAGEPAPASYPFPGGYTWGADYDTYKSLEGMRAAQDEALAAGQEEGKFLELYRPGAEWAGHTWTEHLAFTRGKLDNVTLIAPYQRQTFNDVRARLEAEGYVILGILVDDKALDLFQLMQLQGPEAFNQRFLELLREKVPQRISYDYFMIKGISEEQMRLTSSINQFLLGMDAGHMQVEVTMLGGEEAGSAPQTLCVNFTYPALARAQAVERPTKKLAP